MAKPILQIALIFTVSVLVLALISGSIVTQNTYGKSNKENKIRDAIVKKLGKTVEGKFSSIRIMNLSKTGSNETITFWNTTKASPPIVVCTPTQHVEGGKCVPNPPDPTPTGNFTTVDFVGDISGTVVRDAVAKHNPDVVIGLGDLTYKPTINNFKNDWYDYLTAKHAVVKCVVGNHDSTEDGNGGTIIKEALALCGDSWWLKVGHVLFLGFNTNGDIDKQVAALKTNVINNPTIMFDVEHTVAVSHKNGHVPLNSKHPVEAASLYKALEALIPDIYEVNGHNHVLAASNNGLLFISGGGGKSHYSCPSTKDPLWGMCNSKSFGFLEFKINNANGDIVPSFYDTSGNIIK